jgi:large subunit ribosomal protein L18
MSSKRVMPFRRKREGRTDYKKRLSLLKSGLPRLVVRKSNKGVQMQVVAYDADGDKVLLTVRASELTEHGWKRATGSIPASYLTGVLLAAKAKKIIKEDLIVDIGLQKHHRGGRIYAAVKGVVDGGIAVRAGDSIFPTEERLTGAHIDEKVPKEVEAVKTAVMK